MLLMLVDPVGEFADLRARVRAPRDPAVTPPSLVLTRLTAHLCAPVFILFTGLSTTESA